MCCLRLHKSGEPGHDLQTVASRPNLLSRMGTWCSATWAASSLPALAALRPSHVVRLWRQVASKSDISDNSLELQTLTSLSCRFLMIRVYPETPTTEASSSARVPGPAIALEIEGSIATLQTSRTPSRPSSETQPWDGEL